eukprot:NODE_13_length_54415_cov_0.522424.p23 type:complete len:305 gc:universal NODE_13_length_54415_cov_0.522424:18222-17308(-)
MKNSKVSDHDNKAELQNYLMACDSGDVMAVRQIVPVIRDLIVDSYGLHIACRKGYLDLVKYLKSHVNINAIHAGKFAIDEAALNGHAAIVKILQDKSISENVLKYAIQSNSLSTVKLALKEADIIAYDTLFQDIKSLEVFELVVMKIVNKTTFDQEEKCFLVDGIHYQFKKIKYSISKNRNQQKSISRIVSPTQSEKHISMEESMSKYLSDIHDEHAPPVPEIPIERKVSSKSSHLSQEFARKFSSSTDLNVGQRKGSKSILKSPATPNGVANSLNVIVTEQLNAGDLSPQHQSPINTVPYKLI